MYLMDKINELFEEEESSSYEFEIDVHKDMYKQIRDIQSRFWDIVEIKVLRKSKKVIAVTKRPSYWHQCNMKSDDKNNTQNSLEELEEIPNEKYFDNQMWNDLSKDD